MKSMIKKERYLQKLRIQLKQMQKGQQIQVVFHYLTPLTEKHGKWYTNLLIEIISTKNIFVHMLIFLTGRRFYIKLNTFFQALLATTDININHYASDYC